MYERILVPTDGSEHAARAAAHALALSRAFDAELHVVTVINVVEAAGPFSAGGLDKEFIERLEDRGEETIRSLDPVLDEADDVRTAVVRGTPSDAILDYAADHEIDLIAMGTHGRSGIRRYIAGSVAERVVRRSDVPVLTVRKTERSRVDDGYDDVLVPVDGSDHAIAAADHAIAIAQLLDARIHAVHVVDVGAASTTPRVTPPTTLVEQLRTAGEVAIDAVTTRANDAGVDVTTAVHEGFPARDLLAYADDHDVDLIAMGTAGRTGLDRFLLGSTAEKLIARAEMPVLSVSADEQSTDQ